MLWVSVWICNISEGNLQEKKEKNKEENKHLKRVESQLQKRRKQNKQFIMKVTTTIM